MAQPGFCLNSGRLTTGGHKFETTPGLIKATNSMDSFDLASKDKFQCTYFRSRFSKPPEKKSSIPWLDDSAASDISDPYSDSDSEADNRRNVARWLESLPTNQDWYDIEDDLLNRQGDFEKGTTSNVETLTKTVTKEIFHASQPSSSFQNDTSTTSRDQKSSKKKFSKVKDSKYKTSTKNIKFGDLKVHFKETPTEIRSENSKYSKLSERRDSRLQNSFESLKESKNLDSLQISNNNSKKLSTSDESNENKVERRKFPYNLRSLESRKVGKKIGTRMNESQEKMSRCRRSCSIRNQEYERKKGEISSGNDQERRNEVSYQIEELKPARKLKSPFTKQASSSKTPALFTGTPCTSSYKLNEPKEMKQNVEKLDTRTGMEKYIDRKVIVKSKLARNKKLLKTVKELVNAIDSNSDPADESHFSKKSRFFRNEEIQNSKLMSIERKTFKDVSKNKPSFMNSKLEKKLDQSMEVALKKYKRAHGTWEEIANKRSSDQIEEPPRKRKKRPVF